MPGWLAFGVTACFALAALWLTIRAWQARTTTPRTVSLVLSSAACVAMLVAAADLEIPLSDRLCEHPLGRGGELAADLEDALESWTWRLSLCRRLQVEPTVKDLATPIEFPRLAAIAAKAGISVDVRLPPTVPRIDNPLRLSHQGKPLLPTNTPIPASRLSEVFPRFVDAEATPLSCRVDHGRWSVGVSLDEMLDHRDGELDRGFHRLQCHASGADPDSAVFAYFHVSAARVLLISDQDIDAKRLEFSGDVRTGTFELDRMTLVPEDPRSQADRQRMAEPANMLIFDRPTLPASCVRARDALAHGTSVVIAMPDPALVAACPDLLPIQPGGTDDDREPAIFDREPRLTYLLDDFASGLDRQPSCIIPRCQGKLPTPSTTPVISREAQMRAVHESCTELTHEVFEEAPRCNDLKSARAADDPNARVRVLADPRGPRPGNQDIERLEHSTPATATRALVVEFGKRPVPIYYEDELIVLFTHDHRSRPIPLDILETGSRVHVVAVKDPYGSSLSHLFDSRAAPRETTELHLVDDPEKRGRRTYSDCDKWRCADLPDDLDLVDDASQTRATMAKLASRFLPRDEPREFRHPAAPIRFGWWEPVLTVGRLGPSRLAMTTTASGLRERALAMGMMIGRGHLLVLGYSPFAGWEPWKGAPKNHLEVLDGHRLIENLHGNTSSMSTGVEPTIRSVTLRPDGAVWVTMIGAADGEPRDHMLFAPTTDGKTIDAPLVDFDDARGLFTYALPAAELSSLKTCGQYHLDRSSRRDPVVVCPPADIARSAGTMHAATLLRLLARYTGGRDLAVTIESGDEDSVSTRPLGLATLSLLLLVAWSRRAARRLSGALAQRRLHHLEQASRRRYDPPDAVVAAAGDWDGRSSTWPRTGAFGGFRPARGRRPPLGDRPARSPAPGARRTADGPAGHAAHRGGRARHPRAR
jgi:hypothetical protein